MVELFAYFHFAHDMFVVDICDYYFGTPKTHNKNTTLKFKLLYGHDLNKCIDCYL